MTVLSPEFQLVCAACRWPRGPTRDDAVRTAAAVGLDWQRVAAITARQRVWGLVADAIAAGDIALPPELARGFGRRATAIARTNLNAAVQTHRIGQQFDAAGIDWLCFKGLPLAVEAYGTVGVKSSNDVDLLVAPGDVTQAAAALRAAGYRRFSPGPEISDDRIAAWMAIAKESGWRHPDTGLIVELHTRLTANPAMLRVAPFAGPRRGIAIVPGISIPTLGAELQFPYLVAHGARDGWFRLKWLADVAALLSTKSTSEIEEAYRSAQELGVGRCAAQALLLSHDLLALPLAEPFVRELRAPAIHRLLVRVALRSMAGAYEAAEHGGPAVRSMLPVTLSNLLLRRGLRYKWHELVSLSANPADRAAQRLPNALAFLYPFLGGARWGARMLGRTERDTTAKRQG